MIQINECPRDAMQGITQFIPTKDKVRYIQALAEVGFELLDMGSFVSPKWVPQMADTKAVLNQLHISNSKTRLNVIVPNMRGVEEAVVFEKVSCIGFPFSISPTFQLRNTNTDLEKAKNMVIEMHKLCVAHQKNFITYLSMAFGNPYGDKWDVHEVLLWVEKLSSFGIRHFVMSDTIGVARPNTISEIFKELEKKFPDLTFAAHFHSAPNTWEEKLIAALDSGCTQFDGAIKGLGGCPMAKDELTGNMPTEKMIAYLEKNKIAHSIDLEKLNQCVALAQEIFPNHLAIDHFKPIRKSKKPKPQ